VSTPFISLQSSAKCVDVKKTISGIYSFDTKQNWDSDGNYVPSNAAFILELNAFTDSTSDITVSGIKEAIYNAAVTFHEMKHHNLAYTMLLGVTYMRLVGTLKNQMVRVVGDVVPIYGPYTITDYSFVTAHNIDGVCKVNGSISLDFATSQVRNTFSKDLTACSNGISTYINKAPYNWMKDEPLHNNVLFNDATYVVDLHTFAIAMSVNLGFISLSDLIPKQPSTTDIIFDFQGTSYTLKRYTDPRYSMKNIVCPVNNTPIITKFNITQVCFVKVYPFFIYGLPLFNHIGNSYQRPQYCDCNSSIGTSKNCNKFNWMSGLMFYRRRSKKETYVDDAIRLMTLIQKKTSYEMLNDEAYLAQFYGYGSPLTEINSAAYMKSFDFCRIDDHQESCTMINLYSIQDPAETKYIINLDYGTEQRYGSCSNFYEFSPALTDTSSRYEL